MTNQYSPTEYVKNVYSLLMTKLTLRQARFIRRPVYIRGARSLKGCRGLTTGRFCRFDLPGTKPTLFIGDDCEMGDMTHIVAHEKVQIGSHVLIASKCFISDTNHGRYHGDQQDSPDTPPNQRKLVTEPVIIGNNVWIGENAVILAGARIGDGCIIGANSVVTKVIEPGSVVTGANVVKRRYSRRSGCWESMERRSER